MTVVANIAQVRRMVWLGNIPTFDVMFYQYVLFDAYGASLST
jgi:hypothetical protein